MPLCYCHDRRMLHLATKLRWGLCNQPLLMTSFFCELKGESLRFEGRVGGAPRTSRKHLKTKERQLIQMTIEENRARQINTVPVLLSSFLIFCLSSHFFIV